MHNLLSGLSLEEKLKLTRDLTTLKETKSNEFTRIVEWLEMLLREQDKSNRSAVDTKLARGQGRAILLADLLESFKNSRSLFQELKSQI